MLCSKESAGSTERKGGRKSEKKKETEGEQEQSTGPTILDLGALVYRKLEVPGQAAPGGHQVEMQPCRLSFQTSVSSDDLMISNLL